MLKDLTGCACEISSASFASYSTKHNIQIDSADRKSKNKETTVKHNKALNGMKVCYVCDNRVRENFGCRATSMALHDIVALYHEIDSTIYGDMTKCYNPRLYKGESSSRKKYDKLYEKLIRITHKLFFKNHTPRKEESDFITDCVSESLGNFLKIYSTSAPLMALYQQIANSDAVILNGEGVFNFRQNTSYELKFDLFVLALAQHFGKKTYIFNAMFSDGTGSQRNNFMLQQTKDITSKCTKVTARDYLSYQYYRQNISDNVIYIPDALWSWTKYINYIPLATVFPYAGVFFPETQNQWNYFDFSRPYIAISGGSYNQILNTQQCIAQYVKLTNMLKTKYRVVIVQACAGESFLKEVAKQTNTKIIEVHTNILFGMSVLANAQCYVSGRWHPSILASLGGTPCVMLGSNSHKSTAIYQELKYNSPSIVYPNPPSDIDIVKIFEQVEYSISNISRERIKAEALNNSKLLKQYEQILK